MSAMKTNLRDLCIFAALACLTLVPNEGAALSVGIFYDKLEPYGDWLQVADYGYCWHPRDVEVDWRPYSEGAWAYTDAGWTWVSDEPYGWAVYHYGRWARVGGVGWVWVPDTEWAPAWVSWRRSDRYVGWAPLPPESRVRLGITLGSWVDSYYDIGPTNYCFIEARNFGAPLLTTVLLPPRENIAIINQTTNITNITYRNDVVINNGPDYAAVSRESAQPIRRFRLERREDLGDVREARLERFRPKVQGDSLVVAAPALQRATTQEKPGKLVRRIDRAAVDRGWKNAGDPMQVAATRAKLRSEAKAPEGLPPAVAGQPAERGKSKRGVRPERTTQMPEAIGEQLEPGRSTLGVQNQLPGPSMGPDEADQPVRKPGARDTTGPERPEKRPQRSDVIDRPERPERSERAQTIERPERPERTEPPGKKGDSKAWHQSPAQDPIQRNRSRANVQRPEKSPMTEGRGPASAPGASGTKHEKKGEHGE
jgi:hypothetical protein